MQIRSLPARAGLAWIRDGWRLYRRQPLGLPAMAVIYISMLLAPLLLPGIGVLISGTLAPFATVGLMNAVFAVDRGRAPVVGGFAEPFRPAPARLQLFRLGLLNAALLAAIAAVLLLASGDRPAPETVQDVPLDLVLLQIVLYLPVLAMMWFAPLLAGWNGLPVGKAVFGSVIGCLRNIGALVVYALGVIVIVFGTAALTGGVLTALDLPREFNVLVMAPLALLLTSFVQATFYPMYRAIYAHPTIERD